MLPQILDALLPGDRLTDTLTGTSVGLGSLAAARKILAVPLATIALDFLEAGDIRRLEAPQRPFNKVIQIQERCDPTDFIVVQFFGATLWINIQLLAHFQCGGWPKPADVPQGNMGRLVWRDVYALNTGHGFRSCFEIS